MNNGLPEPMGLRVEEGVHAGRSDMRALCGDGMGRKASGGSRRVRVIAIDGDKWKNFADIGKVRKGGCGFGVSEAEVPYTLNCTDRHIVGIIP